MDFCWSDEQEALRRSLAHFASNELGGDLIEEDQHQTFFADGWKQCARMGLHGLPAPEAFGGGGADILTVVCALEALGSGTRANGLIFSINAHLWGAVLPIAQAGTADQKQRLLAKLTSGEWIGARALAESGYENEPGVIRTHATREPGGWRLNGSKTFVINGTVADLFVVYAIAQSSPDERAATSPAASGLSVFLVAKDAPGLKIRPLENMGLRSSALAALEFNDCVVAGDAVLGELGGGDAVLAAAEEWESICYLAGPLGMMQRQLDASARYAAERRQFGHPIGKFPAVAAKIADMEIRLETSRLVLYKAAWLKSEGKSAAREAAIAGSYVADAAIQTCRDTIQVHGGYGYMTEYQMERDLRDAVSGKMILGSGESQKKILAGLRGL